MAKFIIHIQKPGTGNSEDEMLTDRLEQQSVSATNTSYSLVLCGLSAQLILQNVPDLDFLIICNISKINYYFKLG
jgi:hypothetical protein